MDRKGAGGEKACKKAAVAFIKPGQTFLLAGAQRLSAFTLSNRRSPDDS
jgi:hypothetical protein